MRFIKTHHSSAASESTPRPDSRSCLAHDCSSAPEGHRLPRVARISWYQRMINVLNRQGLPAAHFEGLWAGHGNGMACARCSEAIKSDHVEYELRFRQGMAASGIQLHRGCWEIWWRDRWNQQPAGSR